MQAVTSSQGNLSSIAKELESAQKKAAKGGRKAEEASSSVAEASRSWESEAPYIFEQLQALDERRVNHMRDVLTQLQTHEVDQVERTRASAESCLNALLSIETADEIKTFAAKTAGGRDSLMRRQSSAAGSTRPPSSSAQIPPTPPPPRLSQREPSYPGQDRLAPLEQTPHKSKLGGLKRLGTVMNRRKSTIPLPPPSSEKKEKKARPFSAFRRGDSSRSFQDLDTTGQDLTPSISEEPRNELTQVQSTVTETQESFTPPTRTTAAVDTTPTQLMVNGTSQPLQPVPLPSPPVYTHDPPQARTDPMAVLQPTTSPVLPQSPPVQELPTHSSPTMQQGGFPATDSEEGSRNFAIRDQPIPEDESEAQAAMSNMANQLRMQAQTSGLNRVQGSVRGRRDVRNTMFLPSGVDTTMPGVAGGAAAVGVVGAAGAAVASSSLAQSPSAADLASPIAKPPPRTILEDHALGSDTTSIHSSRSLVGQAHHSELHDPGLNASIVETVNTFFSEAGVTKSFVTGEIALAYNPITSETDTETIRLQQFELLEKVATNPMFITSPPKNEVSITEESAGTYNVSLSGIHRSTPVVGLKYQLHIDETSLAQYSPLLITPAWQLVEGQASIIVLYSLNPTFAAASSSSSSSSTSAPVTLKNVIISVSLDPSGGNPPQSAMMAPQQGASFRRKAASVTWRLNELTVKPEQERLLVRFMTPGGTAKKGSIEVKFELQGRAGSTVGVERKAVKEKDPFADEGERVSEETGSSWEEVSTRRCLVSGRYSAA